jgi:hypothetical protein
VYSGKNIAMPEYGGFVGSFEYLPPGDARIPRKEDTMVVWVAGQSNAGIANCKDCAGRCE